MVHKCQDQGMILFRTKPFSNDTLPWTLPIGNANIFDSGMSFLCGLSQTSDFDRLTGKVTLFLMSFPPFPPRFKREYSWYTPPAQVIVVSASSSICCVKSSKSCVVRTFLTQIIYVTWASIPVHPWHTYLFIPLIFH